MISCLGECSAFFWCRKKWFKRSEKNISTEVEQSLAAENKLNSHNPIIRARDPISFVVPSTTHRSYLSEQQPQQQKLHHTDDKVYNELEMSSLNNVRMKRHPNILSTTDFNLELYSPGQDINNEIHKELSNT